MSTINCPNCKTQLPVGTTFCPDCGVRLAAGSASAAANSPIKVLQGRYELQRKLGQGGMGSVYLATDRRLSTATWAVKEMSDQTLTNPLDRQQASEAFKQEAEFLAQLSHPNLPRVTDHFAEDGKNYLVMELVPGDTLLAFLQQSPPPQPLAKVLDWARQLCDVLAYLHSRTPPIIFRDLKPANVMITPEGTLKLVDFGIARMFKPGQAKDTQAYGTMGYSAPEQYGRGQTDARSDIYSLAVLLHQVVTGHDPVTTPFRLPRADTLNPQVTPQLASVLAQATDNDPERRFSSIEEFRRAFVGSGVLAYPAESSATIPLPNTGSAVGSSPLSRTTGQAVATPSGSTAPVYGQAVPQAPYPMPARETTSLAATSLWMGCISLGVMAAAALLIGINLVIGDSGDLVGGFGTLIAIPVAMTGPIASILALIALLQSNTAQTLRGRRHAAIGAASGIVTLLLCCAISSAITSANPTPPPTPTPSSSIDLETSALLSGEF